MSNRKNDSVIRERLEGLIAAPFTPFSGDGRVDCGRIEPYARFLEKRGVSGVFVCGTTGEGASMTVSERKSVLEAWMEHAGGLRVIAHVGHASVTECEVLAAHAEGLGVDAISAMPSSRTLPENLSNLVSWCDQISKAAPMTPFYYYHIPSVSGVTFPMRKFLALAAEQLPRLAGVKFTHEDLMDYIVCLREAGGRFDIAWGRDEALLGALAVGARSAVGSTYNFASPLYCRLIDSFKRGDLEEARECQFLASRMICILGDFGGLAAIKSVMALVGMDMGISRLPMKTLEGVEVRRLETALKEAGVLAAITDSAPVAKALEKKDEVLEPVGA